MSITLNVFLIMLMLAHVLTQLHVSVCASLSLRNRDMTTDAVVGLVLPVVCSLRLLLSVSNTCFSLPSQPFTIMYRREPRGPHTHVTTMPKMLVMLSKMPALCSMLSHANYAQNYARLIGAALFMYMYMYIYMYMCTQVIQPCSGGPRHPYTL